MRVFFLSETERRLWLIPGRLERSSCSVGTTLLLIGLDGAPASTSTVFQAKGQSGRVGAARSCTEGDRGW